MSRYRKTMLELLEQVRESKQKPYVSMSSGGQYNVLDSDGKTAYSTRDKTLAYAYFKKNYDKLKEEADHEISMARGELEAIADKALQLASILKDKTDDDNLEAWVQSKITKAKDYINSVNDYMTYNPEQKQNEELEEAEDYGLKGTITDKQLQNIKSVWANKTKKDITPGVKTMLSKLDTPTKLAIKQAKINVLSDLVEELEEAKEPYGWTLVSKAKDIAKKFANNMTKAVDEIEKLQKGLSNNFEVVKALRQYNEDTTQRPSPANPTGKELDEKMMPGYAVRYTKGDERLVQAYKSKDDAEKRAKILKYAAGGNVKDVSITGPHNLNFKEFTEELEEGIMKDIYTMDKEGASAEEIAKRLNIKVSAVKNILGEQKEEPTIETKPEVKKEDDKQAKLATKDQQIETLKGQVALLKQKVENEKNKAIKPEPNPKTGEVPLTIGVAYREFKKQELKKEEIHPHAKEMAKDGVSAEKIKKMHPEITADELKKITEDNLKEKVADSIIKDLQKSYADLKGKTISPEMANKLSKHLDQPSYDLDTLRQLVKANIPFISTLARNKIYKKIGKFEDRRLYVESITGLQKKADQSGMPYSILKQVYDRGMAAWKSGHRPGASQQQWAFARVNSFVTKSSGTWGGADKDLAAKIKGSK